MGHKYYDELGIKGSKICLFNTDERETEKVNGEIVDSARQKNFDEQRRIYGFDDRETWALDFTAAAWLHSHLKMYLEIGGKIVDLTFHKFTVPVILEDQVIEKVYDMIPVYAEEEQEMTQRDAINLCIRYLEDYIREEDNNTQKGQCAFRIFAKLLPAMWW